MTSDTFGKRALRVALESYGPRYGLDRSAVNTLVDSSQVMRMSAGQRICGERDRHDFVYFVISEMVQIVAQWRMQRPVIVDVMLTGRFFWLAPLPSSWKRIRIQAVARGDALIALTSFNVIRSIFAGLSPERLLHCMTVMLRSIWAQEDTVFGASKWHRPHQAALQLARAPEPCGTRQQSSFAEAQPPDARHSPG